MKQVTWEFEDKLNMELKTAVPPDDVRVYKYNSMKETVTVEKKLRAHSYWRGKPAWNKGRKETRPEVLKNQSDSHKKEPF